MTDDLVLTFKGQPITDLSKQELIAALTWAYGEIKYHRERADRCLQIAALPDDLA